MIAEKLDNLTIVILRYKIEDRRKLPTDFPGKMHMQRLRKVSESNNYLLYECRQDRWS